MDLNLGPEIEINSIGFQAAKSFRNPELPECAGYRQFVRDLNPCVRGKLLMCGGAVFDSNVRDLVNLEFIK